MRSPLAWLALSLTALLGACGAGSAPDTAPANVAVAAGDASAVVSWTSEPGLEYWVFHAEGATISYETRTS